MTTYWFGTPKDTELGFIMPYYTPLSDTELEHILDSMPDDITGEGIFDFVKSAASSMGRTAMGMAGSTAKYLGQNKDLWAKPLIGAVSHAGSALIRAKIEDYMAKKQAQRDQLILDKLATIDANPLPISPLPAGEVGTMPPGIPIPSPPEEDENITEILSKLRGSGIRYM